MKDCSVWIIGEEPCLAKCHCGQDLITKRQGFVETSLENARDAIKNARKMVQDVVVRMENMLLEK